MSETLALAAENSDEACVAAEALLENGQALAAMEQYARVLATWPTAERAYYGAAKSLLAGVTDGSISEATQPSWMDPCLRTLVLQRERLARPAILGWMIATLHAEIAERVGKLLSRPLREIFSTGQVNANSVVLLLVIRRSQASWLSPKQITDIHLSWFPKFSPDDLILPYNFLFETPYGELNRSDISSWLDGHRREAIDVAGPYSLIHALYMEVLSRTHLFATADQLVDFILARRTSWDTSEPSLRAAKSLIVRYAAADTPRLASRLATLSLSIRRPDDKPVMEQVERSDSFSRRMLQNRASQALQAGRSVVISRFPFLHLGRRLKVAICVSGQLRGYRDAFASWQRTLLPAVDHTIFVHSWRSVGRSSAEPVRYVLPFAGKRFTDKYREACRTLGFDEFKRRYPSLFSTLRESAMVTEPEIKSFYATEHVCLSDENEAPYASMSNQQKMHNKIEASYELMRSTGQEFDLVIRLRPDKAIKMMGFSWAAIENVCKTTPTIFADHAFGMSFATLSCGDQFAVGSMRSMEIYSRTWSLYPTLAQHELYRCGPEFEGHCSLAQVCWTHGIDIARIPMKFGLLTELEPLGSREILECLNTDARGRKDRFDDELIAAATMDAG